MRLRPFRALVIVMALVACASPHAQPQTAVPDFEMPELWQEPTDLLERDLYYGPGGQSLAPPQTGGTFQFVAFKTSGTNPGYDVKDSAGRPWSVKLGIEAQPEVTVSRILWAMGYHQPPNYFVHEFNLTGTDAGLKTISRFRADMDRYKAGDDWDWHDNPFKNTKQFRGLIVAQLILNNWDLKQANNRIYEAADPSVSPKRIYMVRDVGSSLGHSKQSPFFKLLGTPGAQGSKNDLEDFEAQGFVKKVDGDDVSFDYRGLHQPIVDMVTVPDVIWACEQMAKIPDTHWQAAFRAGAYPDDVAERYIRKIKEKIAQGLALRATTTR
ncbi:MAG TPA: hypothetical protein VEC39_08655 [Vicinamibacterales bacterium]|nr:hypothetical protein [Vicinamibacterales bacterium]